MIRSKKDLTRENSFRYERKFLSQELGRTTLQAMVKILPGGFNEIYHQRQVNNIYFDTFDYENYFDNVDGSPQRKKVRIRWYGEINELVQVPILEVKIKYSLMGTKLSYPLPSFNVNEYSSNDFLYNLISQSNIPRELVTLIKVQQPKLINTYSRTYYESVNTKIRITIDDCLSFYDPQKNEIDKNFNIKNMNTILEVKYPKSSDTIVNQITSRLPLRLSKSSKYVTGINSVSLQVD
jgi:SPX domain protein involved in polyphosphate accumulation